MNGSKEVRAVQFLPFRREDFSQVYPVSGISGYKTNRYPWPPTEHPGDPIKSPITLAVVKNATDTVIRRLDDNFFRVRFDRLTPGEKHFLRAAAELGSGPYRTSDIAEVKGVKIASLGPVRAKMIKKGMIYSPAHGEVAFTVPLFNEFMLRAIPEFEP
jgi:hypothetical protein